MSFKITFIGAGSIGFTRRLLSDILSVPEFSDIRIAFTDINEYNLGMVQQLCQRDIDANGLNIKIESTTDRREALKDAKYIINCVRIGGLEAFATDINIPLKYGIDQCVGDTLCMGGIMYGQRGISAILDFCKDIREVSAPDAILLNYANPNAMLTWAANTYGGVNTIGLCHGIYYSYEQIAKALGIPIEELDITCAGINHMTWFISVKHKGEDMTGKILAAYENDPELRKIEKTRIEVLRNFGYYSTETNGHLSEYLPWFRKRADKIFDWIDLTTWSKGETGGYLRYTEESRNWFETDFPKWFDEEPWRFAPDDRSIEHGSYIIESLETGRVYRCHINVINRGYIPNLSDGIIVELPTFVNQFGLKPQFMGNLPAGIAAKCEALGREYDLLVDAAIGRDRRLARQAMYLDPLCANCDDPDGLLEAMIRENLPLLPGGWR